MAKKKSLPSIQVEADGVEYARYSSHAQKDASIEQQIEKCDEFASINKIHIIERYKDRAITGKTDRRADFQRMMHDAEKGKFKYVIAWKSNRMGRNMLEAMLNEAKLQDLGIRVLYVEEDFDDTAAGRFALRSMMNVNQFYSENMAEDIKRGLYDNAANCKVTNGHLPYGYKADEDLKYTLDDSRAAVVREIFTRVSCGEAIVDIYTDLNLRGLTTSLGNQWGRSSFNKLLSNERYLGIYIYGDVRIDGGIPRIVSDELFYKVQEVLKTKKNARGRHRNDAADYLLTGKLYCGHCKSPMTGISGTSRTGALHYYYVCQKKRQEKSCEKKNVKRDEIELQLARAIKEYCLTDDLIEWYADKTVEYFKRQSETDHIKDLQEDLANTQRSIKNTLKAIDAGIITESTRTHLIELEAKQSRLSGAISAAKSDVVQVDREDLISSMEMVRDGDTYDKKYQALLFDTFLIRVYLYDDDLELIFSCPGVKNSIRIPLDISAVENTEETATSTVRLSSTLSHHIRTLILIRLVSVLAFLFYARKACIYRLFCVSTLYHFFHLYEKCTRRPCKFALFYTLAERLLARGCKFRRGVHFFIEGGANEKRGQALQLDLNLCAVLKLKHHPAVMENRSLFQQSNPQPFVPAFEDEGLFFYGFNEKP